MGAEVKSPFNSPNAASASRVHMKARKVEVGTKLSVY